MLFEKSEKLCDFMILQLPKAKSEFSSLASGALALARRRNVWKIYTSEVLVSRSVTRVDL